MGPNSGVKLSYNEPSAILPYTCPPWWGRLAAAASRIVAPSRGPGEVLVRKMGLSLQTFCSMRDAQS